MSTIELEKQITSKIFHLEDENLLIEINEILNSKESNQYFNLSDFEKKRAESGRKHQLAGTLISNKQVKENVEKWLKSK